MRTLLILTATLAICLSIAGCSKSEPESETTANVFLGEWTVDYDRTLEKSKESPKYDPETAEKMANLIKNLMEKMKLHITETELIYHMGQTQQSLTYTIDSTTPTTMVVTAKSGDEQADITFTLIEDKFLNLKSSASDDMNYYIFKPAGQ